MPAERTAVAMTNRMVSVVHRRKGHRARRGPGMHRRHRPPEGDLSIAAGDRATWGFRWTFGESLAFIGAIARPWRSTLLPLGGCRRNAAGLNSAAQASHHVDPALALLRTDAFPLRRAESPGRSRSPRNVAPFRPRPAGARR